MKLVTMNDYDEFLHDKGFTEYYIHEFPKAFIVNIYIKKIFFFKNKLEKEMNEINMAGLIIYIHRII